MVRPLFLGLFAAFLSGCGSDSQPPTRPIAQVVVGGLTYRGKVQGVEPGVLRGEVTIANETESVRSVTFRDGCVVLMRAFRDDRRVWDQGDNVFCTMALVRVELGPGEERTFATEAEVEEILGDELPEGAYSLTLYLRPLEGEEIELKVGEFELRR